LLPLFASPFTNFQSLLCSLNCVIAVRVQDLYIPGLSKSITICNSANSLSQIGNQTKQIAYGQLANFNSTSKLAVACAGLTGKGYIY